MDDDEGRGMQVAIRSLSPSALRRAGAWSADMAGCGPFSFLLVLGVIDRQDSLLPDRAALFRLFTKRRLFYKRRLELGFDKEKKGHSEYGGIGPFRPLFRATTRQHRRRAYDRTEPQCSSSAPL